MKTCARQIVCEMEKTIQGEPEVIFPMLCPVLEEKWIPNWEYELVHSKSGENETGCIFRENISGTHYFEELVTATWTTILHDSENKRVEFILFYDDKALARSSVEISRLHDGYSRVKWQKTLTLLKSMDDKFSDQALQQKVMESLEFIADSLSYYFETGHMRTM
jgi:hypothetical protein